MNGKEPVRDTTVRMAQSDQTLDRDDVLKLLEAADLVLDRARDAAQGEAAGQEEKDAYETALKAKLVLMQELKLRQLSQDFTDPHMSALRLVYSKGS